MEYLFTLFEFFVSAGYFAIFLFIVNFTLNETLLTHYLKELNASKFLSCIIRGGFLYLIMYLMKDVSSDINNSLKKAEILFGI